MKIEDITSIKLSIGSSDYEDIDRGNFNISIADSIYNVSPVITVDVTDSYGLYLGSRVGGYGVPWNLKLSAYGMPIQYQTRAESFEIKSTSQTGEGLGGEFSATLLHDFMFLPSEVKAYKNKSASSLIGTLFGDYDFYGAEYDYSSSSNLDMDHIYNPNLTPYRFLQEILLPLSSPTTDNVNNPYYVFIDAQNRLKYISLNTMLQRGAIKTLSISSVFRFPKNDSGKKQYDPDKYSKVNISAPFSQKYTHIFDIIDTETCRIENGEYSIVNSSLGKIAGDKMPFYDRKASKTQYMSEDYFQTSDEMMRLQAGINLKNRKAYLIDKLVVTTILDLDLCAGNMINLESYFSGMEETPAKAYTGKYLIESSVHRWSAEFNSGVSQLVLATPSPSLEKTVFDNHTYEGEQ